MITGAEDPYHSTSTSTTLDEIFNAHKTSKSLNIKKGIVKPSTVSNLKVTPMFIPPATATSGISFSYDVDVSGKQLYPLVKISGNTGLMNDSGDLGGLGAFTGIVDSATVGSRARVGGVGSKHGSNGMFSDTPPTSYSPEEQPEKRVELGAKKRKL